MFAFEILSGYLYLHADLGSGAVKVKASRSRVDDGVWHDVALRRVERDGRVTVDTATVEFRTPGNESISTSHIARFQKSSFLKTSRHRSDILVGSQRVCASRGTARNFEPSRLSLTKRGIPPSTPKDKKIDRAESVLRTISLTLVRSSRNQLFSSPRTSSGFFSLLANARDISLETRPRKRRSAACARCGAYDGIYADAVFQKRTISPRVCMECLARHGR